MGLDKYPYVVTAYYTMPIAGSGLTEQHFSFEDIGLAHLKLGELSGKRFVRKVTLSVLLKTIEPRHLRRNPELPNVSSAKIREVFRGKR